MARPPPKRARPPPPPPSEAVQQAPAVPATKTNKRSYRTFMKVQYFDPYRPFNRDEMKVLDSLIDISKDKVLKKRVVGKDRSVKPAYDDDDDEIFDANGLFNPELPGSAAPVDLKEDPSEFRTLTRCATLAIDDYNSYNKTIYRFVNIEMATWQLVNGLFYHITFRARNAEKEYRTFQATVFSDDRRIQVMNIRMKGSSTWYVGTLSELD